MKVSSVILSLSVAALSGCMTSGARYAAPVGKAQPWQAVTVYHFAQAPANAFRIGAVEARSPVLSEDGRKALDHATHELQRQAGLLGATAVELDPNYEKRRVYSSASTWQNYVEVHGTALLEK